jgi:Tfp pilus assembly protein PilF
MYRYPLVVVVLAAFWGFLLVGCGESSVQDKKAKHRERAVSYFDQGKYQEAMIEFKNVVQIDPKDADAHYRLALTHLRLQTITDMQSAFHELSKSVELDPANRDAQIRLAELYLLGRDSAKARQHADAVLASAPGDSEGLVLRGKSLINEQDFDECIRELK